jgi:hypothetical protein
MDETLRCNVCGGRSPADSAFCIECGQPLAHAITGPTKQLDEAPPPPSVYTRPASPAPPVAPAPPITVWPPAHHAPLPPARRRAAPGGDLLVPLLVGAGALSLLFAPRLAPMILVAIGVVGLLARGMLTRPDRVLPLLVLVGFLALLISGGKLFWPVLIGFFVLRAVLGGCRKSSP